MTGRDERARKEGHMREPEEKEKAAKDEAANPFESSLFAVDGMTVKQYLHGRGD